MAWKSISARPRTRSRPSLGHLIKALKQRPPRYRRLSLVTKPRSSAPTRGLSCAAVAMAARRQQWRQRPVAMGGDVEPRAAAAPSRSRRCVPTAHQRRYYGRRRQPLFWKCCPQSNSILTAPAGNSRPAPRRRPDVGAFAAPRRRRGAILRIDAGRADGPQTRTICTPTLRKKMHIKTGSRASPAPRPSLWNAPSAPDPARSA